ncbi:MAG TPA: PEP-CTERM sorting domain-containing protein, partial [Lacipirellulaceae bacterium]
PDVNIATLGNPEAMTDQWLIADYRTGNTNAFGLISLAEGNYSFEGFQLEEGGDSGYEVWVAAGDHLATGFNSGVFFPLTTALLEGTVRLTGNQGLGLVQGPGTGPSGGALDGDFDGDGDVDAADYVVWRKTDNTPAGYTLWRTNFGRTAGSGSALSAVPEPASALLLTVCLMMGGALVSRRRAN